MQLQGQKNSIQKFKNSKFFWWHATFSTDCVQNWLWSDEVEVRIADQLHIKLTDNIHGNIICIKINYCNREYFYVCKCLHMQCQYFDIYMGCSFRAFLIPTNNVRALFLINYVYDYVDKFVQASWCTKSVNINVAQKFPCLQYPINHLADHNPSSKSMYPK